MCECVYPVFRTAYECVSECVSECVWIVEYFSHSAAERRDETGDGDG